MKDRGIEKIEAKSAKQKITIPVKVSRSSSSIQTFLEPTQISLPSSC
jgi:hypothetical protein